MFNIFSRKNQNFPTNKRGLVYKNIIEKEFLFVELNDEGNIKTLNDMFATLFNISKIEIENKPFFNLLSNSKEFQKAHNEFKEAIKDKKSWRGIIQLKNSKGETFDLITILSPLIIKKEFDSFILTFIDFTQYSKERRSFYKQFYIDSLTGYANRTQLIDNLTQIGEGSHSTMIIFDIDSFKNINNFYGYSVGDELLKDMANWLSENRPTKNTLFYKLSADTFAMLITSDLKREVLIKYIEDIIEKSAKKTFYILGNSIVVNITIGASQGKSDYLKRANSALSKAKRDLKSFTIFDDENNQDLIIENNIKIVNIIKKSLNDGKVFPYFQPIVDLKTGKIVKFETLMRLENGGRIFIPEEFLEFARNSKLYPQLVFKMLTKALSVYQDFYGIKFSINFYPEDFVNSDIMDFFVTFIQKNALRDKLIIEILEGENISNYKKLNEVLENLKSLGCEIAIDDFGSGYSNFEHILKLKLDYIKLDGSLIQNVNIHRESKLIVQTINLFAKHAKIKTIAEYVHNSAVYKIVKAIGVDYAQGYFISAPVKEIKF